jgi:Flp pilus assembly protein TadG
MLKHTGTKCGQKRTRGMAMIYVLVSMTAMLGFCSLAVDLGRVQMVKTELRRAADAAARAACASLASGATKSSIRTVAANMAAANSADGTSVAITKNTDVELINWVGPGNFSVVNSVNQANGVRVYCRRTKATSNAVSLTFASVLGASTCDVTASSIAVNQTNTSTQTIGGHSNPWLAGEPTGTTASVPDAGYPSATHPWKYDIAGPNGGSAGSGEPYDSPVQVGFNVSPGATITFTNTSGDVSNVPTGSPNYDPTGNNGSGVSIYNNDASNGVSEHGMSDVWAPLNSFLGVFLTSSTPDGGTPPPVLDFSTQAARDYTTLSPKTQQIFYIGDGQTSSSTQQSIVVPQGATRFFLGTMDGHEWSNNSGSFTATITQTNIALVQ